MSPLRWLTGVWLIALLSGLAYVTWRPVQRTVPSTNTSLAAPQVSQPAAAPAALARMQAAYGKLPLYFEVNRGQTAAPVQFLSRGPGYTLFLTPDEAVLRLQRAAEPGQASTRLGRKSSAAPQPSHTTVMRTQLVGANPAPQVDGEERRPGVSNYFIGNDPQQWHTNIAQYGRVRYHQVYPGIDLLYHGTQGRLEYDFIVAPGADPAIITLAFDGADSLEVDDQGDLLLHTPGGVVRQQKPVVYQEVDGLRQPLAGHYVRTAEHQVGFAVAAYDTSRPLVIDPVLLYSTYLGGASEDVGFGIAVDAAGSAYVTGRTSSLDFPIAPFSPPPPPLQGTYGGGSFDAFVAKLVLDPDGVFLEYATYLGGSGEDEGFGIAVDGTGSAYITGRTGSADFPTVLPSQPTLGGNGIPDIFDAFVAKLTPGGTSLEYATYLGDSGQDQATSIAVDAAGSAYVTGHTDSPNFPVVMPALQETFGGGLLDAFVAKFAFDGSILSLEYATYLGGDGDDAGLGIAVDASMGEAYVTGRTGSTNFPTTVQAFQTVLNGPQDAFVVKLAPDGTSLTYATYLGGNDMEEGTGIALDIATGDALVIGSTNSTDFPTVQAIQPRGGGVDAFVVKLAPDGAELFFSTYLGGSGTDEGTSIALGSLYVTGRTNSDDFPTLRATQPLRGGGVDAFVVQLTGDGSLSFATYLGGSADDAGLGIAVHASGSAYVTGSTSSASDFPVGMPVQSFGGGLSDAFVTRFSPGIFTVNSTADEADFSPGDGVCMTDSGTCTLRAAIQEANALPGADTIVLEAETYLLTLSGPSDDVAALGDLDITDDLTITGKGVDITIVDGNAIDRVFHVQNGAHVIVNDLTIRNGLAPVGGGGILNEGSILTLNNVMLSGNAVSSSGRGGGLSAVGHESATTTLNNCTITGNSAFNGGGLANDGASTMLLQGSTVYNNTTTGNSGAGIINSNSSLTLINSTVSTNVTNGVARVGGGIATFSGTVTLMQSTIANNTATGAGGGLYAEGDPDFGSATVHLSGSIVANNTASPAGNCASGPGGTYVSNNHNLASDAIGTNTCNLIGANDLPNTNPRLGPLMNNGGLTFTHALLFGSPAIDRGATACTILADQRNFPRPVGSACDIGAFESASQALVVNATGDQDDFNSSVGSPNDGVCETAPGNAMCTLRAAIRELNAVISNPGDPPLPINFNIPGAGPHRIQPGSPLPTITTPVVLDGYTQPGAFPNTNMLPMLPAGNNAVLQIEIHGSPPGGDGLLITAGSSVVRGLVINSSAGGGITLQTNGGNRIEGNFLGTDVSGLLPLANQGNNVAVLDSPGNIIGSEAPDTHNVIASSTFGVGVYVMGTGSTGNFVQGNFIGTDATGTVARGNTDGVTLDNAPNNVVGGPTPGMRNLISGNVQHGIALVSIHTTGNVIQGNLIGTQADGTTLLGNGQNGVTITGSASRNNIGVNTIFFNGAAGIAADSGTQNAILANTFYANGGLGIDLDNDGVTFNDPGDVPSGANNRQNFPVLTLATSTTVQGTLNSTPNTSFKIEFFASPDCDPSGFGEGKMFLDFHMMSTNGTGDLSFIATLSNPIPSGHVVTATATDPLGNTSEFSQCLLPTAGVVWINPGGGLWSDPNNWSPATVPGPFDDVSIILNGTYTVMLDIPATIASLTLGAVSGTQSLSVNVGQTLTLNGASAISASGVMTLGSNSTLAGSGSLTNSGIVNAQTSTMSVAMVENQGSLVVEGMSRLDGLFTQQPGAVLHVKGTGANTHGVLIVATGFTNPVGAQILLDSDQAPFGATLAVTTGVLDNLGLIQAVPGLGMGGQRTLTAALTNQGMLQVQHPLTLNNAGLFETSSGSVNIAGGQQLTVQGGTTHFGASTSLGGMGSLDLAGMHIWQLDSDFTQGIAGVSVQVAFSGSVTVQGAGRLVNPGMGLLTLTADTVLTALENQGTLIVEGVSRVDGALTQQPGAVLRIKGTGANTHGVLIVATGFTNPVGAQILLDSDQAPFGATLVVTTGVLDNLGLIQAVPGLGMGGQRTLTAALTNQGMVEVQHSLTINNPGTFATPNGILNIAGMQLLQVVGGTTVFGASTALNGTGTLDLAGMHVWQLDSDFVQGVGVVQVTLGGSVTVQGMGRVVNLGTFTLTADTVLTPFENRGTLIVEGVSRIDGAFTQQPGAVLRIKGTGANTHGQLTVANGFTNPVGSQIILDSDQAPFGATLAVTTGALDNQGLLQAVPGLGMGGQRTLMAALTNQGTGSVQVQHPLTINGPGAMHTNSGMLTVSGADLTISNIGSFTNTGAGLIDVAGGRTLTFSGGTVTNMAGLQGTGTLNVASTIFTNAGVINPGMSAGLLNFTGDFAQAPAGILNIDLGGLTAGSQFDRLSITGNATLNGTLNVRLINGFVPSSGDSFTVLLAAAVSGTFAMINPPPLSGAQSLTTNVPYTNNVTLQIVDLADLQLTSVLASPDPTVLGTALTYTITVANQGPGQATNVVVTSILSAPGTFVPGASSPGCLEMVPGTITCPVGTLASMGPPTSVTVVVMPTALGPLSNTAQVTGSSTDPDPANNTQTAMSNVISLGDVNGDGVIDSSDAQLVLKVLVGQPPPANFDALAADVDGDGVVTNLDSVLIQAIADGS